MSARKPISLLIVDPNVSLSSPSMRGVVLSLPELKARGFQIEVWCWHCDAGLPVDKIVRLPRFGRLHTIGYYAFSLWATLRSWWHFRIKKQAPPQVIYTIAWYLPRCEVAHVHFSPWDWEMRQRSLGIRSLRDAFERGVNLISLMWADAFLRRTTARSVLCVSEAVAADVRRRNANLNTRVLPNCYDPERFHAEVPHLYRETMRATLQFAPRHKVFAFASAGHYRRKGFFLAVEALRKLRASHSECRLLVVGGRESRLCDLQAQLDRQHPDWREWITFTGMVPDVEKYFAAADAFLFPSYSEAFALVEVEAAACGLPLFLTRHHGSEMILEDGVNGRLLDFDAAKIAGVLDEFVTQQWKPSAVRTKHALDKGMFARQFAEELAEACTA